MVDKAFGLRFINDSDKDVYVLLDYKPLDGSISNGSNRYYLRAFGNRIIGNFINNKKPVKDSIHIYIIDAARITLRNDPITQEDSSLISEDMILSIITLLDSDIPSTITYSLE